MRKGQEITNSWVTKWSESEPDLSLPLKRQYGDSTSVVPLEFEVYKLLFVSHNVL